MYVIYAHALEGNTKEVYMVNMAMNECHDINRSISTFLSWQTPKLGTIKWINEIEES